MRNRTVTMVLVATLALLALADAASAYYSPRLGRFLSRDPISEPGAVIIRQTERQAIRFLPRDPGHQQEDTSPYRFLANDPPGLIDPLGLTPTLCGAGPCGVPDPPLPPAPTTGCCAGKKYELASQCCEDGKVVDKVRIWFCTRAIDTWYGPTLRVMGFPHCYICCDGANQNCVSKGPHNTQPGKIDPEASPNGSCGEWKVCPRARKSKCENPQTDSKYDAWSANCCDWALQGLYAR